MDDYEKADKKGNRDNIKDFRPWNYYPWLLRVFDINNYFLFCLMLRDCINLKDDKIT